MTEKLERGYSTVPIYKHYLMYLAFISAFTGKSKAQIINEFVKQLYDQTQPLFAKASLEKKQIGYSVDIIASVLEPMVVKSRKIDMRKSNEQLDKEMLKDVESEFAKREASEFFDKIPITEPKKKVKSK